MFNKRNWKRQIEERISGFQEKAHDLLQEGKKVVDQYEVGRHMSEAVKATRDLSGTFAGAADDYAARHPRRVHGLFGGGAAGLLAGTALGGGGIGLAAFGGAVGIPLLAVTAAVGAAVGYKLGCGQETSQEGIESPRDVPR